MFLRSLTPILLGMCSVSVACQSHRSIKWFPCTQNGTLPLTCGTLSVPLDYTNNTSNVTLDLQLVKINAIKPKKGSILINPGGLGEGGRDFIAGRNARSLQVVTGGVYDLIGFDPRYIYPLERL